MSPSKEPDTKVYYVVEYKEPHTKFWARLLDVKGGEYRTHNLRSIRAKLHFIPGSARFGKLFSDYRIVKVTEEVVLDDVEPNRGPGKDRQILMQGAVGLAPPMKET